MPFASLCLILELCISAVNDSQKMHWGSVTPVSLKALFLSLVTNSMALVYILSHMTNEQLYPLVHGYRVGSGPWKTLPGKRYFIMTVLGSLVCKIPSVIDIMYGNGICFATTRDAKLHHRSSGLLH